jgi:TolA-binding protein
LWLQTLNWRRNPDIEKQINASKLRTKQLESESAQIEKEIEQLRNESLRMSSETEQIKKENARLSELNSKLDAIVFSSATNSTQTKSMPSESEM